jgi:hypothetical protein
MTKSAIRCVARELTGGGERLHDGEAETTAGFENPGCFIGRVRHERVMEPTGLEPVASSVPRWRSPN